MHQKWNIILSFAFILLLTGCATKQQPAVVDSDVNLKQASLYNVQLGMGYLQEGNLPRAKQKLMLALQQTPNSPTALDAMAYYLEIVGDKRDAETYYKKALAIAPKSGRALNNYGTFLCRNKNNQEAIQYFMAATRDPNYVNTAEAYENAGLCSMQAKNVTDAKKYFARAIQQDPQRVQSLYQMASINYQQGQYTDARNNMTQLHRYSSPSAASLWLEIQIAAKLGDQKRIVDDGLVLKAKFSNSPEYKLYQQRFAA